MSAFAVHENPNLKVTPKLLRCKNVFIINSTGLNSIYEVRRFTHYDRLVSATSFQCWVKTTKQQSRWDNDDVGRIYPDTDKNHTFYFLSRQRLNQVQLYLDNFVDQLIVLQ